MIGGILRKKRGEQSLRSLSSQTGVAFAYIAEIELGLKEPSSEVLEALCSGLDIHLPDLLRDAATILDKYQETR